MVVLNAKKWLFFVEKKPKKVTRICLGSQTNHIVNAPMVSLLTSVTYSVIYKTTLQRWRGHRPPAIVWGRGGGALSNVAGRILNIIYI